MKKLIISLLFLSSIAMAGNILSSSEASKLVKKYDNDFDNLYYEHCKRGLNYRITEASKKGESYIHVDLHESACFGNMPEKLEILLKSLGYRTNLSESIGINGIHFTQILTVSW